MSRFADPTASARFVLPGGCQCDGTPHEEDYIELRTELGTQDIIRFSEADDVLGRVEVLAVSWNLVNGTGDVAPLDRDHLNLLYADIFDGLEGWIEGHVQARTLPNGSGARSRNGSRASASPTRTTKART